MFADMIAVYIKIAHAVYTVKLKIIQRAFFFTDIYFFIIAAFAAKIISPAVLPVFGIPGVRQINRLRLRAGRNRICAAVKLPL